MTSADPSIEGPGLAHYRGVHAGESIVGCGVSAETMCVGRQSITIGVNDVGRMFDPTCLVVVNPRNQFKGDRFRVASSRRRCSRSSILTTHGRRR